MLVKSVNPSHVTSGIVRRDGYWFAMTAQESTDALVTSIYHWEDGRWARQGRVVVANTGETSKSLQMINTLG
jgi:DUF1009 family protein